MCNFLNDESGTKIAEAMQMTKALEVFSPNKGETMSYMITK